MTLATFGHILGGIGIFLLAVSLLTQGLQMAGSDILRRVMVRWTKTPFHSIGLGLSATALLQSSSAATVIILGLVNAGILPLGHAIWMIMGSNIGTTLTGWLVSTVGLDFDIKAFALPFIGIGMMMRLFLKSPGYTAAGLALTGFGLFFLGIDILKDAFSGYAENIGVDGTADMDGFRSLVTLLLIGCAATILTQSSSAATALILTGTAGGLITLEGGAAMIIGANMGTSFKAVLIVIGAAPNARRAAAAHVMFNLLTAAVALAILPLLLTAIAGIERLLDIEATDMVSLALFHTLFNIMGVLLISPFVPMMTRFLEKRFVSAEEEDGRPHYLDDTTLEIPAMALDALLRELKRLQHIAARVTLNAVTAEDDKTRKTKAAEDAARYRESLSGLSGRINNFADALAKTQLSEDTSNRLQYALRINRYLHEFVRLSGSLADVAAFIRSSKLSPALTRDSQKYLDRCIRTLRLLADEKPLPKTALALLKKDYGKMKDSLLRGGVRKAISVNALSHYLDSLSLTRRMMEQGIKARLYLLMLEEGGEPPASADAHEEDHDIEDGALPASQ